MNILRFKEPGGALSQLRSTAISWFEEIFVLMIYSKVLLVNDQSSLYGDHLSYHGEKKR